MERNTTDTAHAHLAHIPLDDALLLRRPATFVEMSALRPREFPRARLRGAHTRIGRAPAGYFALIDLPRRTIELDTCRCRLGKQWRPTGVGPPSHALIFPKPAPSTMPVYGPRPPDLPAAL